MQDGRLITVLNEHELMEHIIDVSNNEEDIIDCHMKVKQIIIDAMKHMG